MQRITLETFLESPEYLITAAAGGEHIAVSTGDGNAVVMIDEAEWEMLRQALNLCTEHPEWMRTNV